MVGLCEQVGPCWAGPGWGWAGVVVGVVAVLGWNGQVGLEWAGWAETGMFGLVPAAAPA